MVTVRLFMRRVSPKYPYHANTKMIPDVKNPSNSVPFARVMIRNSTANVAAMMLNTTWTKSPDR